MEQEGEGGKTAEPGQGLRCMAVKADCGQGGGFSG